MTHFIITEVLYFCYNILHVSYHYRGFICNFLKLVPYRIIIVRSYYKSPLALPLYVAIPRINTAFLKMWYIEKVIRPYTDPSFQEVRKKILRTYM